MNSIPFAPPPSQRKDMAALRSLLRERFPQAEARVSPSAIYHTGLPCLDAIGVRQGGVAEIVEERWSGGTGVLLAALLERSLSQGKLAALIDGGDSFDPSCLTGAAARRLLWVRCRMVEESCRAADLLLRDGNLPLVALDLRASQGVEVARVPSSTWHRLRASVEKSGAIFFAFTPRTIIPRADFRLRLAEALSLESLEESARELAARFQPQVERAWRQRLAV